jgi:predicted ribosome quality control (RQC) complex YloA/Tae2 family protein
MEIQIVFNKQELHLLKYGRHFRLDSKTKVIVGRTQQDNELMMEQYREQVDVLLKHNTLPGPDVILTGDASQKNIETAAFICAGYTKSPEGATAPIRIMKNGVSSIIMVRKGRPEEFKNLMI